MCRAGGAARGGQGVRASCSLLPNMNRNGTRNISCLLHRYSPAPIPYPPQFLLACSAKRALSQGFLFLTSVHLPTSCLPEIQGRPPVRPLTALSMPNRCSIRGCCWHSSPPKGDSLIAVSSTHLNPSLQLPRPDEPREGRLNCSLNERRRVILYEAPSKLLTIISVHIRQPRLCFNLR